MNSKEFIIERATDIVYHYTNVRSALDILSSGFFKLSSTAGTKAENEYAPPGYPYFLSLSRSKVGDYHRYVGPSGVMFVLDGRWLSSRYPVKPIDYWYAGKTPNTLKKGEWSTISPENKKSMWQYNPERTSESEDRLFSKENAVPIDPVTAVHIFIREADERHSPWIRQTMLAAKARRIKTYLYNDLDAWRFQDTRKAVPASELKNLLKGAEPSGYFRRPVRGVRGYGKSSLLDWIELIKKNPGQELSKSADKLRYNIRYYGDFSSQLENDLHNAKKPDSSEYGLAVKLTDYMTKNRFDVNKLMDALKKKWGGR